jgi:hypothetical protein
MTWDWDVEAQKPIDLFFEAENVDYIIDNLSIS